MSMNNVVAVVVTYNRCELLKKCIEGIYSQEGASCDLILIDNASTDGTSEYIKSLINREDFIYMRMDSNLGCAESTKRGMKEAVLRGYRYIWIMDDDVFPHDNTLSVLLEKDKRLDGKWGMMSSIAYWTDGSLCKANIQKKGVFSFLKEVDYKKEFVPIKMMSLASMFIKADVIKDVGLLIGEYGIYTEDYEFTSRVARKYPVYAIPESTVTHAMKVNMKVNIVKDTPDRMYRYKYLYRNDVHCYKQYGFIGFLYLIIKYFYTLLQILIGKNIMKKEKINTLTRGFIEGIRFRPTVEYID